MVTHPTWALALISSFLIACTPGQDEVPADGVAEATTVVSGADTAALAQAPTMAFAESGVDSIYLNVKKGNSFQYRIEQSNTSFQDSMKVTTAGNYVYDLVVKNVRSDGSVEFGMTFTEVKMDVNVNRDPSGQLVMENHFNSKDSAQLRNPQNAQFSSLIGEQATVLVSSSGELLEVSGLTPVINKILAGAPPQQRENAQLKEQIKLQLESAMYAQFIGQQMIPYPDKALDASGTWTKKQSSPVFGGTFLVNSSTDYQITGIKEVNDHRIAEIDAAYNGSLKLGPPPKDATTKLTINSSKITGSSKARLDLNNGMTVSKENRISMSVQATAADPEFGESKAMAQRLETTFKITLLK